MDRVADTSARGVRPAGGADRAPGVRWPRQQRGRLQTACRWLDGVLRRGLWIAAAGAAGAVGVFGAGLSAPARAAPSQAARALVRAAVAHAHLDEATTQRLRARAHLAPLLPSLRVSAGQGWQVGYSRGLDGLTVPSLDGDRFSYAVSASWDLGHVLLPREELSLLRELPRRAQLRTRLELQVLGLLAERCRLRQPSPGRVQSGGQRLAEVELLLDVLSGGHPLPDASEPCSPVGRDVGRDIERSVGRAAARSAAPASDPAESSEPADPGEAVVPGGP